MLVLSVKFNLPVLWRSGAAARLSSLHTLVETGAAPYWGFFGLSLIHILKYQILLAFTCTLSVTGITLLISAISKNQIVAFVASMATFLFPVLLPITEANPLFRLIGLLPLYHVQAVSLLSVEQMNNGMLYAVWAIPTALVFLGIDAVISRRVFAKHQVS